MVSSDSNTITTQTVAYDFGLLRSNVYPEVVNFYVPEWQDYYTGWILRKEHDGSCLPHGQQVGDDGTLRDEFGCEAAQILARADIFAAECLVGILLGTMLLQVLAVYELAQPTVLYTQAASAVCALSSALSLVSLFFYKHKWCDEKHGGECSLGAGAYLVIAASVVYFVSAILVFPDSPIGRLILGPRVQSRPRRQRW